MWLPRQPDYISRLIDDEKRMSKTEEGGSLKTPMNVLGTKKSAIQFGYCS